MVIRYVDMDSDGIWNGDMGMERKGEVRKDTGKVY